MSAVLPLRVGETSSRASSGETAGAPALEIRAVSKSYERLEAIRHVAFDVREGEFVSVLGPSGCGKSTLLMMIAGPIAPSAGAIAIGGRAARGPRREVGVVFQSPVLLPWRSVIDNV